MGIPVKMKLQLLRPTLRVDDRTELGRPLNHGNRGALETWAFDSSTGPTAQQSPIRSNPAELIAMQQNVRPCALMAAKHHSISGLMECQHLG